MQCRVQYLNDTDPFNCASFPEPARPVVYTFLTDVPLVSQLVSLKRLLGAPHYVTFYTVIHCSYSSWDCWNEILLHKIWALEQHTYVSLQLDPAVIFVDTNQLSLHLPLHLHLPLLTLPELTLQYALCCLSDFWASVCLIITIEYLMYMLSLYVYY